MNPAGAAVVVMLRALKMYGMAQAVSDLTEQGAPAFDAAVPILSQLLKAELAERPSTYGITALGVRRTLPNSSGDAAGE